MHYLSKRCYWFAIELLIDDLKVENIDKVLLKKKCTNFKLILCGVFSLSEVFTLVPYLNETAITIIALIKRLLMLLLLDLDFYLFNCLLEAILI